MRNINIMLVKLLFGIPCFHYFDEQSLQVGLVAYEFTSCMPWEVIQARTSRPGTRWGWGRAGHLQTALAAPFLQFKEENAFFNSRQLQLQLYFIFMASATETLGPAQITQDQSEQVPQVWRFSLRSELLSCFNSFELCKDNGMVMKYLSTLRVIEPLWLPN